MNPLVAQSVTFEGFSLERTPIIVLASPSAGGKTTQRRLLLNDDPTREFLVSYTTRAPRPDEIDGVDYHFVSESEFQRLREEGDILFEHTSFYGNHYATPRKQLEDGLAHGKQLIADVNLDGLKAFRNAYPGKVSGVFIMPASLAVLEKRLAKRITDAGDITDTSREEMIAQNAIRLEQASTIMEEATKYDCVIEQEDLSPQETFMKIRSRLEQPAEAISTARLGKRHVSDAGVTRPFHAVLQVGPRTHHPSTHLSYRGDNGVGRQ